MECFRGLRRYRPTIRHRQQQDPAVFHVHFSPHPGFAHYNLYGPGFLEKYAKVYPGSKAKPLVVSLMFGVRL